MSLSGAPVLARVMRRNTSARADGVRELGGAAGRGARFTARLAGQVGAGLVLAVVMTVGAGAGALAAAPQPRTASATAVSDPAAPSCRSVPAPAADLLRASEAWTAWGVDGTGVRVGIISDSFDSGVVPTAADDVAAGVLPGPGNPCGRETPVLVLSDSATPQTDEGRAMAQVLHGVAPGAEILFAAVVEETNVGLAAAIGSLRDAGADIIIDDVGLSDDRAYQRGAAGAAVQAAVDAGILYLAAAGNYGMIGNAGYPSARFPIGGWSTSAYTPTPCSEAIVAAAATSGETSVDCMDFDPGPASDPGLGVVVSPEANIPAVLDWAEPDGGVVTALGYGITLPDGEAGVRWAPDPDVAHVEGGVFNLDPSAAAGAEISFVRRSDPGASTPAVSLIFESDSPSSTLWDMEHFLSTATATATVGATLIGHQADPATLAVGAVNATTSELDFYSAGGPAEILFGIPAPAVVPGPAVVGVDALPISFDLVGTTRVFSGTSAAVPSVAGVAALVRQASPQSPPTVVREALTSTARPEAFKTPWDPSIETSRVSGAGLVDAFAAVAAVLPDPPVPTPPPTTAGSPARLADSGGSDALAAAFVGLAALTTGAALVLGRSTGRTPTSGAGRRRRGQRPSAGSPSTRDTVLRPSSAITGFVVR